MNPSSYNPFFFDLLTQPTAPFRESAVVTKVIQELARHAVPHFLDPSGNVIVGAASREDYLKLTQHSVQSPQASQASEEPLRLFIAHMDHPGFHGCRWRSPTELEIKWHGGSPTLHLEGAKVWLASQTSPLGLGQWLGQGTLTQPTLHKSGKALSSAVVHLENGTTEKADQLFPNAAQLFGGFGFRAPIWQENDLVYTKAADDLVGVFAIVSLAIQLWKEGPPSPPSPFLGILTRAEEVGFIGALAHFELGWLQQAKRPLLCVSLETSRTLPGAEIGKGPVVRLGDRFTVFSPEALSILSEIAQTVLPNAHQKRIMDGGTCEASAATVYGFPSIGISVPLGNYHNQSIEGGPDAAPPNGPAPEFVHLQDVQGLIKLCHGLLQPNPLWSDPWKNKKEEFRKSLIEYESLLKGER